MSLSVLSLSSSLTIDCRIALFIRQILPRISNETGIHVVAVAVVLVVVAVIVDSDLSQDVPLHRRFSAWVHVVKSRYIIIRD